MPKRPLTNLQLVPPIATSVPDRRDRQAALTEAEVTAITNFERALGGRLRLVEALASSPDLTAEVEAILQVLGDPRFDKVPLATICRQQDLHPGDLFRLLKDAELAKANIRAIQIAADALPAVMQELTAQAQAHKDVCPSCNGTGQITPEPTRKNPTPAPITCRPCNGQGEILVKGDFDTQKLLLEVTKLLPRPGMNVGIQTNTQINAPGAGGMVVGRAYGAIGGIEQLQQAINAAIYSRPQVTHTPPPSTPTPETPDPPVVDADVLPPEGDPIP